MHAHAQIGEDWAKEALPFLYQGITTVVLGVDGGGSPDVADTLAGWEASGIGVNALTYVGHGAVRRLVLGEENRAPHRRGNGPHARPRAKGDSTRGRSGSRRGSFTSRVTTRPRRRSSSWPVWRPSTGRPSMTPTTATLGSGLSELRLPGVHRGSHPHRRGGRHQGHLQSLQRAGRRQLRPRAGGRRPDRRGPRAGASRSPGPSMSIPRPSPACAPIPFPAGRSAGGREAMLERFEDPDTARVLDEATAEMLAIRGGADKIRFSDPRPHLNGRTPGGRRGGVGRPPLRRRPAGSSPRGTLR